MTPLQKKVVAAFQAVGLDPAVGCAIIEHESNWDPQARSDKAASDERYGGAWGLSQMLVPTARSLGYTGDGPGLWDVDTHIQLLIKLIKRNILIYKSETPEDLFSEHNSGKKFDHAPQVTREKYVPATMKLYDKWKAQLSATASQPPLALAPLASEPVPEKLSEPSGNNRLFLLLTTILPYLLTLLRAGIRAIKSR